MKSVALAIVFAAVHWGRIYRRIYLGEKPTQPQDYFLISILAAFLISLVIS